MHIRMFPYVRIGTVVVALALGSCVSLFGQASVLTQHNDLSRTGQNTNETILTPANVGGGNFGKVFSLGVDGLVLAQPLYIPKLAVNGATHNVVFVATEHDSVYAFDADAAGTPLWQASLLDSAHGATLGATTDPESDTGCMDINGGEYGITGTPVIDPVSGTLYVVSLTFENNYPLERLHALDVKTGAEKFGGPVVITGSARGTGSGSSNGVLTFDPKWEFQRAALTLVNGSVYVAFASHCDYGNFHGWVMGYNATTLAQTGVFITTPNSEGAGIWMSGGGPPVDVLNGVPRMFLPTGNGAFDATLPYGTNTMDYADDILTLNLSNGIQVTDMFTPLDQLSRGTTDIDLGSGGAVILPDQPGPYPHLLVQLGKGNALFVVNRDNLGGYSTSTNNVVQEIDNQVGYFFGVPAYWNGNIYIWAAGDRLKQFSVADGKLSATPIAGAPQVAAGALGMTPSISANGTTNAIVWTVDWSQATQVAYAHDATNVANTLWSSATNSTRDSAGDRSKFIVPTVVNGKVYVGSANQVMVYGLLPDFALAAASSTLSTAAGASGTDTINVSSLYGFSGAVVLSATNLPAGVTATFVANNTGASSVATFKAAPNTVSGVYPVIITGVSGSLTHSVTVNLNITPAVVIAPSFSLTAGPSSVVLQQGSSVASKITVVSMNGFTGAPAFSAAGLPTGITASFSPASSATATTVTFAASSAAWVGSFTINVTGTSGSLTKTVPLTLSVTRGLSLTAVQIINKPSGRCLEVSGISTSAGAPVGQWDCWGGANQSWNLTLISAGVYRVTSVNSNLSLDITGGSTTAGAIAIQNTYTGAANQKWTIKTTADGYFTLVNGKSNMCLGVTGASLTNGAIAQQSACSTAQSQEWAFAPLTGTKSASLAASYNVNAIGTDGTAIKNGGLDLGYNAFPLAQIGTAFSWYGYNFTFGPAGAADAVSSTTVALPNGQYNGLYFLATAVNGSQPNQIFRVNYSDGTSKVLTQNISDWGSAQNYPGENTAFTSSYRLIASGSKDPRPSSYYGYGMDLDSTKTVVSITLPANRDVIVLAITLSNQAF